jgi:hypothetical protein
MFRFLKTTRPENVSSPDVPTPDLSRVLKPQPKAHTQPKPAEPHASHRPDTPAPAPGEPVAEKELDPIAWLERDVATLSEAFDTFAHRVSSADARRQLFIASHNLRGTATPLGNPVLERLAASLCKLLEETNDRAPVIALANLHVGAMRAALVAGSGSASDELAQAVCVALEDQVAASLKG